MIKSLQMKDIIPKTVIKTTVNNFTKFFSSIDDVHAVRAQEIWNYTEGGGELDEKKTLWHVKSIYQLHINVFRICLVGKLGKVIWLGLAPFKDKSSSCSCFSILDFNGVSSCISACYNCCFQNVPLCPRKRWNDKNKVNMFGSFIPNNLVVLYDNMDCWYDFTYILIWGVAGKV